MLERARLGCQALLAADPDRRSLCAAHRHLGQAGYLASDHLPEAERRTLLHAARRDVPGDLEELLLLAMHGSRVAGRAVREASFWPEMHEARLHAIDAVVALGELVGGGRWHEAVSDALRRREFDPDWERSHLPR